MSERTKRVGAFFVIYVVWGSTFTATRVVVLEIPPMLLGAFRFGVAGILLLVCARQQRLPLGRAVWREALAPGMLMVFGGVAMTTWALAYVDSAVAALFFAAGPMWMGLIHRWFFSGPRIGRREWLAIALGILGVAILIGPWGHCADLRGLALLLIASIAWPTGALLTRSPNATPMHVGLVSAHLLVGASATLIFALVRGEAVARNGVSLEAMSCALYLGVFGSALGMCSYLYLMRVTHPVAVASNTLVNPLIAVSLGVFLLDEPFTPQLIVSAIVILTAAVLLLPRRRAGEPSTESHACQQNGVCADALHGDRALQER